MVAEKKEKNTFGVGYLQIFNFNIEVEVGHSLKKKKSVPIEETRSFQNHFWSPLNSTIEISYSRFTVFGRYFWGTPPIYGR